MQHVTKLKLSQIPDSDQITIQQASLGCGRIGWIIDVQQLCDYIFSIRTTISEERFQLFVESMQQRIKAAVKAKMGFKSVLAMST